MKIFFLNYFLRMYKSWLSIFERFILRIEYFYMRVFKVRLVTSYSDGVTWTLLQSLPRKMVITWRIFSLCWKLTGGQSSKSAPYFCLINYTPKAFFSEYEKILKINRGEIESFHASEDIKWKLFRWLNIQNVLKTFSQYMMNNFYLNHLK